jgi:class 3 adenylate cyclase
VLATVLFTDVVQSTERLVDAGDRDWRVLLDRHDAMVRAQLAGSAAARSARPATASLRSSTVRRARSVARVAGLAGAGEVLTTGTVKDLVAGSGIAFSDRGDHTLKGVPDAWRIFAATA